MKRKTLESDLPVRGGPWSIVQKCVIRFVDVLLAMIGLFFSLPLMLFIVLAIKLSSKGPAFYIQERLGQFERPFRLFKFRTMRVDAELCGPQWAGEDDIRVTKVGKYLRKARLDELPQLFNVLRSDISFVGPRPIRKFFADQLKPHDPRYEKRFLIKPGLTGWAQIYAPYGATVKEQLEKLPFDMWYLDGLSLRGYLKVLLLTTQIVMKGKGI